MFNLFKAVILVIISYASFISLQQAFGSDTPQQIASTNDNLTYKETEDNGLLFFKFDSQSFCSALPCQYRYRIIGHSDNWMITEGIEVNFDQLPPGNYRLEAEVLNSNLNWEKAIYFSFEISPPFWKTWGFISTALIILFALLFISLKYAAARISQKDMKATAAVSEPNSDLSNEIFTTIKCSGKIIRINTATIGYFKSAGNYVEIYTRESRYVVRSKLSDFYASLPDAKAYMQLHRSYYVRSEHVSGKGNKRVWVYNTEIPVSKTYLENLNRISFDP